MMEKTPPHQYVKNTPATSPTITHNAMLSNSLERYKK